MKTVRLASVISSAGKPMQVTLWTDPEKDPAFKKALKEERVMTINQENVGQSKDSASVDFKSGTNKAWLIFKKPISDFKGQKVIGINYDLIESQPAVGALVKSPGVGKSPEKRIPIGKHTHRTIRPPPPAKAKKTFVVSMRFQASKDIEMKVEAYNRREAEKSALGAVQAPDMNQGEMEKNVVGVRKG